MKHICEFTHQYSYCTFFTENFLSIENTILKNFFEQTLINKSIKVQVFIDENVHRLYPDLEAHFDNYIKHHRLELELLPLFPVKDGEEVKNDLEQLKKAYELILERDIDRHSYLISIGGGSCNDFVGFIATTAHRGIKHIRIPTTVLAQNDAAIGVKNGINFKKKKNFIGTFSVADLIINDVSFLKTLDKRDYISGYAEAVKIALIKDKEFFEWIEKNTTPLMQMESAAVKELIERTAKLHTDHFANSGDPFEKGSSRPLDYGHWLAHALEALSGFELRHGEAVGLGMLIDTTYAFKTEKINEKVYKRIQNLLETLNLTNLKEVLTLIKINDIQSALEDFRVHLGGALSIPHLIGIGEFSNSHHINTDLYWNIIQDIINEN